MFNSDKIAALQEQNTKLTADLAAAVANHSAVAADLATASASLEAIKAEKATLETSVSTLTGKVTELEVAKTAAETQAKDAIASVDAKVNDRLASAGVDPVKRDPSAKQGEGATMSRAEFEKMGHEARDSFMRNGGKIVG